MNLPEAPLRNRNSIKEEAVAPLDCETLEQRIMLSTVEIFAAGSTNEESINLQIDGQVVQSWDNLGGDADAGEMISLSYSTAETLSPDQIRIEFTNDLYDPANNLDRNVRIDAIVIDGLRFEAEDPSVYSTGTWLPEDGLVWGFRENEYLNAGGYFQFASTGNNGSLIEILARGNEGTEQFELHIDGQIVGAFDATQSDAIYSYQAGNVVNADQVRVVFTNDVWDPDNNFDANLIVDSITIDGVVFESESPSVYSTGTWLPEDGIQPGYRESEVLHTNGYFQYEAVPVGDAGTLSLTLDSLTVGEDVGQLAIVVFRTGGSTGTITVDYTTVHGSTNDSDYASASGTLTFADGVTDGVVLVAINDDQVLEDDETFSLVLSNPTGGASLGSITQETVTIADNDEFVGGILFEDGFEDGFNWVTNPAGTDGATTGQWEIGAPQQTSSGATILQLASGSAGARGLITGLAAGGSVGSYDVDAGVTTAISPTIDLPVGAIAFELRFDYYFAHLDNATTEDYFSASIVSGGITDEVFVDLGSNVNQSANWQPVTVDLSAYAGQSIQVLFTAADEAGGSLVEAGVDQVVIEAISDSPGILSVATTVLNLDESAGVAEIKVVRNGGRVGAISVDFATATGTASADDFSAVSGQLTFADGQAEATISVPIVDDAAEESLESFTVTLSNPTNGAALGSDSTATITIVDNDNATGDYLPDLVSVGATLTEQLSIDTSEIPGRTLLRFSSEVGNAGVGPLEIWGGSASGDTQEVFQRIYQEDGGSRDLLAGQFVYHANHGHVHLEGFANYNLLSTDGSDTILASGGKTSFCVINIRNPFPDATANAAIVDGRGGDSCGQTQGLSVGYSDVYSSSLDDQWIDITDVADGTYWLEVIADPDDAIVEMDETNNDARVLITISNGQVTF